MQKPADAAETAVHRKFAAIFFNETWAYLDKPGRSPDDDACMIHLAHASRAHWELAGTPQNMAVGEWQIARVYSTLGRKEPALYHARRCLEITQGNGITGFSLGSAHEGMARALRLARDPAAEEHLNAAETILNALSDPEDFAVLKADLASIPAL